jgi:cephalosporin hydroxylase
MLSCLKVLICHLTNNLTNSAKVIVLLTSEHSHLHVLILMALLAFQCL